MCEKLPGMLLSLLIILKVFGATEASCSIHGSTSADCSYQRLTSVPQDLPTGITELWLQDNLIRTLDQSDFSQYGNLTQLNVRSNHIATINSQAFCNLSDLIHLDLGLNRLSNIITDMFTGLGNLETLYLTRNEISDIQAGTFNSTPQLKTLSLSNNKLTSLRSDMFTGLGNLQYLWLYNNEIGDIQAGTFSMMSQLRTLRLYSNKLTSLSTDMFTGLENLDWLHLYDNKISDIQAGTFNSAPKLTTFHLQYNRLAVLKAEIFAELSSIFTVNITNNPWQCDCRMFPFRQEMTGSYPFENQITCEGPSNFHGQKLKDISPEDLICEKPVIVTGTVTTAATTDTVTTVTAATASTLAPKQPRPAPSFSLPVLIGSVCGSVAGTLIIVTIIALIIWCKRRTQHSPSGPTPAVVFSNASASVKVSGHGQTEQDRVQQSTGESLTARNSEHSLGHPDSHAGLEYEDVLLPTRDTGPSHANLRQQPAEYQSLGPSHQPAEYQSLQPSQPPAEYQSLVPNRNRVPSDELPPLPPSQNQTNRELTGIHDTQHCVHSQLKVTYACCTDISSGHCPWELQEKEGLSSVLDKKATDLLSSLNFMGTETIMGEKLPGMLLSLLIILKGFGATEASCSINGSSADCSNQGITSVPQNLPASITELDLRNNLITTLSQSDFSQILSLGNNKLTNLGSDMFTGLGNLQDLRLYNNEISDIQCDCRMLPFRQEMTGSHSFENQITCEGPSNFHGQKLKDISPEDLICEEPTIVRFVRGDNNTVVEETQNKSQGILPLRIMSN
ncbi:leucine-rich repeat transmembrane neuronal protein 4-like [Branchiostoma floridae]|uniref:Leucine-rich repeat transmembrane neuronal protein 4-like n=1 Tax=Branchiostoma floridae TaxID=7739 RepID=A0A9J7L786_BRAFL|nr:leucine-rich repeat transmembrane neuronal protein 4-like [Branchiostoma floridae]